ncbi:hypothetical protein ACFOOK_05240 [Micromonospora krabiensis]|uniref:Uncharacterized protein n=1 Tax=Micromonospora krabiensis TaxID=307121 RepID=A0A1C3NDD6_9ACTN|nr:hypothetical protein [Micromonospora krabiensis]SBV30602.1 hypothetical protein GA0070620_6200 [Micromonospora krabiensis]
MTFEEYAALARQLAEHRRTGERDAAAESERRRNLRAGVDYLHQRLTAQGQRLDRLGRAIGEASPAPGPLAGPPSPYPPAPSTAPVSPAAANPPGPRSPHTEPSHVPAAGPGPDATHAGAGPGAVNGGPGPGAAVAGGAAAAPGRPEVVAYPQVTAGQARLALPGAGSATAAGTPAPPAAADPLSELELARRHADEADRHAQQAELLAQRPVLLPAWSTLARAVAVYAGCAAVGVVLMLALVLASGVGVVDLGTLYAWMCAGLPAASLIAGFLVLGRWGKPAAVAGTPPRHVLLGFLICFVLVPLTYCAYLLAVRGLR